MGYERCVGLADIEECLGFRSVFNFVADDYSVQAELRKSLVDRGFEIGLHGLRHDGSLYHSRKEFTTQAKRINQVLADWGAVGFRSPCMYHNLEWLLDLEIEYDASTFDTDPFEPQPDGIRSIFPVYVSRNLGGEGYVELPYTIPQDFTVFVLMQEKTIDIWKRKLDWIADQRGLALLITHPDYMNFGEEKLGIDDYPAQLYVEFLDYIRTAHAGAYWHVLPRDLARFWAAKVQKG